MNERTKILIVAIIIEAIIVLLLAYCVTSFLQGCSPRTTKDQKVIFKYNQHHKRPEGISR